MAEPKENDTKQIHKAKRVRRIAMRHFDGILCLKVLEIYIYEIRFRLFYFFCEIHHSQEE